MRLQEVLDSNEGLEARMSGVDGEIGEKEELSSMMKAARDDVL